MCESDKCACILHAQLASPILKLQITIIPNGSCQLLTCLACPALSPLALRFAFGETPVEIVLISVSQLDD